MIFIEDIKGIAPVYVVKKS